MPGYRVEQLIGAGSSAEVWRGRVAATGMPVALKRIWLTDRFRADAALAEAALLSTLDHPHLVKLHDMRRVGNDVVLVLDLAAGGSLADLLARRGRLTVGEVVTALAPIGSALAYAHASAVVHGDVSPANVLFTDIGLPLLADLGVARLLGDAAPVRTTPAYADPMVAAGAAPGTSSDVFMLGAVALHALTGSPPWSGPDAMAVVEHAAAGVDPGFADRLKHAGVPDEVRDVVLRALSLDPPRRGTAADFALELRHAAEPVAVELTAGRATAASADSALRLPLTHGVRAPAPFAAGRHQAASGRLRLHSGVPRRVAAAVAVIAVLTGGFVVWRWWPSAGDPAAARRPSPVVRSLVPAATPTPTAVAPRRPPAPASRPPISGVLARLDALRAHAFAVREPAELRNVYASVALLARDQALLTAIVPPGCGLLGVHTRFRDPVVLALSRSTVRLRVRAQLDPSRLVCGGTVTGRAPAGRPTTVLVTLVRRRSGYLIAGTSRIRSGHPPNSRAGG